MNAAISLHVMVDNCPPERLNRALLYLQRVQPPWVNVAGGAQMDIAMQFTERVRAACKQTFVQLRQVEDTGRHTTMSAQTFFDTLIMPRREWLQRNQVVFVPDNESLRADMNVYAEWEAEAAKLCYPHGLRLALGRTSIGNPDMHQYKDLIAIWRALKDYGGVYSPNEGFFIKGDNAEIPGRYKHGWEECRKLGFTPETVIGEFGGAEGYHTIPLSSQDFIGRWVVPNFERWYKPDNVTVCLYVVGGFGWDGEQVDEDCLLALESYAQKNPPVINPPPPPPPVEPPIEPPTEPPALDKAAIKELMTHLGSMEAFLYQASLEAKAAQELLARSLNPVQERKIA